MPNHITNRLTIMTNSTKVNEILDFIKYEKEKPEDEVYGIGTINFNKIIPMPKDLEIESDGFLMPLENQYSVHEPFKKTMDSLREHCNRGEFDEKTLKNFLKGCENYVRYGFATWYEWSVKNWGTKWNAYDQPNKLNTDNAIYFQTAWSCPFKIIEKLSAIYPDVEFEIAWASEDLGYNVGIKKIKAGNVIFEDIPNGGSIEAKKLFFEITKDTLEEHGMDENYEYVEED